MGVATLDDASARLPRDWLAGPDIRQVRTRHEFNPARVADFAKAVGYPCTRTLPPTWPLALIAGSGIWREAVERMQEHALFALQVEQRLRQLSRPERESSFAVATRFAWRPMAGVGSGMLRASSTIGDVDGPERWRSSTAILVRPYRSWSARPIPDAPVSHPPGAVQLGAPFRLTRARIAAYGGAAGDRNPLHTDPVRARALGLSDVPAHGLLLFGLALSRLLPVIGNPRSFAITARFPWPAIAGEYLSFLWNGSPAPGQMKVVSERRAVMTLRLNP